MTKAEFKKLFSEVFKEYFEWEISRMNDIPSFEGFIYWLGIKK